MALLGIDIGGTKLAFTLFTKTGEILHQETVLFDKKNLDPGRFISDALLKTKDFAFINGNEIQSIGISVPGIYRSKTGTVWAPNIPGWEDYPLLAEIKKVSGKIPVTIDSDRACYILGEVWKGNAQQCKDAIFLAVGTGIGAGILINGKVLRGAQDIAGAIGWLAMRQPFKEEYIECGCFEHYTSGQGIAIQARKFLKEKTGYRGELKNKLLEEVTCHDVFKAFENNDEIAEKIINNCIEYWGMATANLVSLFNPEKILFGGGVFGPAVPLIPKIKEEARKWAQPISIQQVSFESAGLGTDAGVMGAGFLALKNIDS